MQLGFFAGPHKTQPLAPVPRLKKADTALEVLQSVFGYDSFRHLQAEIIDDVLNKKDALVVMPTGGGKSLCYQVPALLFSGLTVVVSPLISLMQDQVAQLHELGVEATVLNSTLEYDDYEQKLLELRQAEYDILYLAPETLLKPRILKLLGSLSVDCLAIDEAHCVSEWGHDFRQEYRQLASVRERLGNPVYVALTATATTRVQGDIQKNLGLKGANKYVASFDRANLFLQVENRTDTFKQILNFIQSRKEQAGIIYCFSRKRTEQIQQKLTARGYTALAYHAGLSKNEREKNQDLFLKDKVQIMVATVAFGMGINKSNVRFVIHADLPKNLEGYYQEIGRAGRDGVDSACLLLFSGGDVGKISHFIEQKNAQEKKIAHKQLSLMLQYAESHGCRRQTLLHYFGESYREGSCEKCDNCVEPKLLEDITVPAQKMLSCIHRVNQRFGLTYIIDILRGSQNQRVLENNHQSLSTYAIGKELTKNQWKSLARQLQAAACIKQDAENYNTLAILPRGYQLLKGELTLEGVMVEAKPEKNTARQISDVYDTELFQILRQKRSALAEVAGVPPYMIFSDKALIDMSVLKPTDDEQFLLVHGVGQVKLEKYGSEFLTAIKEFNQG